MKRTLVFAWLATVLGTTASAQSPEILWYDFNLGDATNMASGSVGDGVVGAGLSFPAGPSCGDRACSPTTANATIDTGWTLNLGGGDWSVGMHLDVSAAPGAFMYFFGEPTAFAFRAVTGAGGIALRANSINDADIFGALAGPPSHVCWVYDSSVPEIRGYLNGVLNNTVPQSALNITGLTNFLVMGQFSSMSPGTSMDDFRFYSRAIDLGGVGPGSELDLWVNSCLSTGSCPGSVTEYGAGCPGSGAFVPKLSMSGCPEAGQQVTLQLEDALAPSTALFFAGLNQTSVEAGNSGCFLYVTPVLAQFGVPLGGSGPGTGTLTLPGILPPGTNGASFTLQAWIVDPAGAIGGVSTNGLAVTIAP